MSNQMNDDDKLLLQKMIRENNTENNTNKIRELKHSSKIRKDISIIQNMKRKIRSKDFKKLDKECSSKCQFLFVNYPNIYNKMLKDEIDIKILYSFLDVLEKIENGEKDQHEASYEIGMLLKSIYVDKRLNSSGNVKTEKRTESKDNKSLKPKHKKMSYADFKKMQEENNTA